MSQCKGLKSQATICNYFECGWLNLTKQMLLDSTTAYRGCLVSDRPCKDNGLNRCVEWSSCPTVKTKVRSKILCSNVIKISCWCFRCVIKLDSLYFSHTCAELWPYKWNMAMWAPHLICLSCNPQPDDHSSGEEGVTISKEILFLDLPYTPLSRAKFACFKATQAKQTL